LKAGLGKWRDLISNNKKDGHGGMHLNPSYLGSINKRIMVQFGSGINVRLNMRTR
jgi:hypothetical protein